MVTWDAVVVGGGVAGSIAARELGRRGLRVALLEKARHPRPKPCGEGLLPHGVAALRAMGLDFPGVPITGLRYVSPRGVKAEVDFPSGGGMVVRREPFDAFLFDAAASTEGVEAFPDTEYDPAAWKARWVIGADGLHSQFHRRPEFVASSPAVRRVGLTTHVSGLELDSQRVEVLFLDEAEIYIAPSGEGEAAVACLFRPADEEAGLSNQARVLRLLGSAAALSGRRRELAFTSPVLGAGPLGRRVDPIVSGNVLLVGDAAGASDPVTGEGMSLAILSAAAAARAIVAGRPGDYEIERRRLEEGSAWLGRWILRAARHPFLVERIIRSLRDHSHLFRSLVDVATGTLRPKDVGTAGLLRLVL